MSAHKLPFQLKEAPVRMNDPGSSGTIVVNRTPCYVPLVTAGAETRTLNRPTKKGMHLILYAKTIVTSCTVTITGGYNTNGDTSYAFTASGQYLTLESVYTGSVYAWIAIGSSQVGNLTALTATTTELNTLHSQTLASGAGAGITGGTGTVYETAVQKSGNIFKTTIMIDLTGLQSSTTDLDIIGQSTPAAYIGLLTAAQNGTTILAVSMTCLEAPATGVTDIDLYSATEGTGKFDDAVTGLTETALITSGGAWTNGRLLGATTVPLSTEYLYLTCGAGGTVGTYTAGKFLIEIYGY